jgi:hypothetical protein
VELGDRTNKENIEMLFHISDHEYADPLLMLFYTATVHEPPSDNASKNAFVSFDKNIRMTVEGLVPHGEAIRESNFHTSAYSKTPISVSP